MVTKLNRSVTLNSGPSLVKLQNITLAGASGTYTTATVQNYGVTRIVSTGTGAGWAVKLDAPVAGVEKRIVVTQRSTAPIIIYTNSTTVTIGGTTNNNITFSTGGAGAERAIHLIGVSTAAWSLLAKSTGASLAASTSPY